MSEECNHNCDECGKDCDSKKIQKLEANPLSNIKHTIGIISGKGGVGKSTVTILLANALQNKGYKVGILDADVTGPSIGYAYNITTKPMGSELGIYPAETKNGIKVISMSMLLNNASDPVIWRGPMIGGVVTQFYKDVIWQDLDYLLIDMPPGTSDVALTVFQSIQTDGAVIVSTPQMLVEEIVEKAIKMSETMNIKILGLVENMSKILCPHCKEPISIYGQSSIKNLASKHGISNIAELVMNPEITKSIDEKQAHTIITDELDGIVESIASI